MALIEELEATGELLRRAPLSPPKPSKRSTWRD